MLENATWGDFLVLIFSVATIVCAIAVVVSRNVVWMATWLLFCLAGTAGLFFALGASFIAATQIMLYVGGTLVLVVFGVMLTATGPFVIMKTNSAEWVIGVIVGSFLVGTILTVVWSTPWDVRGNHTDMVQMVNRDGETVTVDLKHIDDPPLAVVKEDDSEDAAAGADSDSDEAQAKIPDPEGTVGFLGRAFIAMVEEDGIGDEPVNRSYLLPFEIASVHLLVVLIGAAYLARTRRFKAKKRF